MKISDGRYEVLRCMLPFNVLLTGKGATEQEARANLRLKIAVYRAMPPVEKCDGRWMRKSLAKHCHNERKNALEKSIGDMLNSVGVAP